ncbi:MAG TPA: hypothetical protein VF932_18480 [Anaerolineae bacterium]
MMLNQVVFQYASWEELPGDYQAFYIQLMDNQYQKGRAFFELYFYWYNVAHEMCHVLRKHYGSTAESRWVDENAVTEFAVAYWREFGEHVRLDQLEECLHQSVRLLPNPIPPGMEPGPYFDANYEVLSTNPPEHGYLQFSWILASLERKTDLYGVLQKVVTPAAQRAAPADPRFYPDIDVDLPLAIIPDMRGMLAGYDVLLPPVQILRRFSPSIQLVGFG